MSKQGRNLVHIIGDPREPSARALSGGSGGGDNGDMDTRLKALESTMVTVVERLGDVETRIGDVETRIGNVETRLDGVETRLGHVEVRLGNVETGLAKVQIGLAKVETRLEYMPTKAELEALRTDVYRAIGAQTWRVIGSSTILVAAVYYIARYVQ